MTNYSDNPGMVRVDYFKAGGKWYMTDSVDMSVYWDLHPIHDAVAAALRDDGKWHPNLTTVILEPYHEHAHPVMFVAEELLEDW